MKIDNFVGKRSRIDKIEVVSIPTYYYKGKKQDKPIIEKFLVISSEVLFIEDGKEYRATKNFNLIQDGLKWTENMSIYKLLKQFGIEKLHKEWEFSKATIRKNIIGAPIKIKLIKNGTWMSFDFVEVQQ